MRSIILLLLVWFICSCNSNVNYVDCDIETKAGDSIDGNICGNYFRTPKFPSASQRSNLFSRTGSYSIQISATNQFALTYLIPTVKKKDHFRFSVWRNKLTDFGALVVTSTEPNFLYMSQYKSKPEERGNWQLISFDIYIPEFVDGKDLIAYLYNDNSIPVWFDDFKIEKINDKINIFNSDSVYTDPRDGQIYKTIKIGNDEWLAENLRFKSKESFTYENKEELALKHGRLYKFNDAKFSSPPGWKLPTDFDWMNMERSLGINDSELTILGFRGYNEAMIIREYGPSGFNGMLSGAMGNYFYNLNTAGYYWTSTEIDNSSAICRELSGNTGIGRFTDNKNMYFSVRCIKIRQ